jgi:hypothetical protein
MVQDEETSEGKWWWYADKTPEAIDALLKANNARPIEVRRYDAVRNTFAVIMQACPCRQWWWYPSVDAAQLEQYVAANRARITDIRAYDAAGETRYSAVMVEN